MTSSLRRAVEEYGSNDLLGDKPRIGVLAQGSALIRLRLPSCSG